MMKQEPALGDCFPAGDIIGRHNVPKLPIYMWVTYAISIGDPFPNSKPPPWPLTPENIPAFHIDYPLPEALGPGHYCAAILFRNCLCFCCDCNVNLSTAYSNLSFFCLSAFNFNALSVCSPPPLSGVVFAKRSKLLCFFNDSPFCSRWLNRPSSNSLRAIIAPWRRSNLER